MSHVFTYELKTRYSQSISILSVSDYNYISLLCFEFILKKKILSDSKRICKEYTSILTHSIQ